MLPDMPSATTTSKLPDVRSVPSQLPTKPGTAAFMAGKHDLVKLEPSRPRCRWQAGPREDARYPKPRGHRQHPSGEAHHIVHRDIGIGAHIAQHRQATGTIGQCVGQARTDRLLLALCQIPKRRDVGRGGSGHGTGRAGREKRVRIALLNGTTCKHDRGLALGHHSADGIVLHADDVGGFQGLHAGMRCGKGVDDFGGTDGQNLDLGICRKRSSIPSRTTWGFSSPPTTSTQTRTLLISYAPYTKMADSLSRHCGSSWNGIVSRVYSYSVTITSRSL